MNSKKLHGIISLFAVLFCTLMLSTTAIAQENIAETDAVFGVPQLMQVVSVEQDTGRVVLQDGQAYQVDEGTNAQLTQMQLDLVSLQDLRPGMEIMVSTDSSSPNRGAVPTILGMWRAQ